MFRFIIRTIFATLLSFAVKEYLEGANTKDTKDRVQG